MLLSLFFLTSFLLFDAIISGSGLGISSLARVGGSSSYSGMYCGLGG